MKWNIYSKLWMIFFVLMGTACTNQVEDAIPVSGQPIEFSVQSDWKEIPNTRLNPGRTEFDKGDTIQIFGFHRSPLGDEVKFMYRVDEPDRGQKVGFNGTNWNYSPKRFWPKEGTLVFYAGYPHYSVLNDKTDHNKMTYDQPDFNPLGLDLLWGVSTGYNCANGRKDVEITMKHALARVNISFSGFSDEIGSVIVSAYKTGWFSRKIEGGIPEWHVDDKTNIDAVFYKNKDQIDNNSVTVFILPEKITGLQVWNVAGDIKIADASEEIKKPQYTFKAGKEYNLTISKGVQKKNTNSRSIAMSVRCVSE